MSKYYHTKITDQLAAIKHVMDWPDSEDKRFQLNALRQELINWFDDLQFKHDRLRAEIAAMQWIPVSERLPSSPGTYEVVKLDLGGNDYYRAYVDYDSSWGIVSDPVVFWRNYLPLPPPPIRQA